MFKFTSIMEPPQNPNLPNLFLSYSVRFNITFIVIILLKMIKIPHTNISDRINFILHIFSRASNVDISNLIEFLPNLSSKFHEYVIHIIK